MKEPAARNMIAMLDTNALAESSARWMQAGLEAFTRQTDAHDFAVHHCAVAVEHLLKAFLAERHPALIVEGRDLDSLLHATGHGRHATVPVTRIKTIGLAEALARAERLLRPQLSVGNRERGQMLAARNGVAHGGLHDPTEVEAVLATCIRIADILLTVVDTPTQNYWGHYRDLHDRLTEERANSIRIRYESKLARARHVYRRRFDGVASNEKSAILTALTVGQYDGGIRSPRACPACGEKGLLAGTTTEIEGADDVDVRMVAFLADSFGCAVCGLSLLGADELELAELPVQIPLYTADDDREPWDVHPYRPDSEEYHDYTPGPDEYDDYEPGDYEAEDDLKDPDWSNYEPDGDAWRGHRS